MGSDNVFYGQIINRDLAKELGIKFHFTGHPCKRGHYSERRTSTHNCIECDLATKRQYYLNNKEEFSERAKKKYAENRDERLRKVKEYSVNNAEKVKKRKMDSYYANHEENKKKKREAYKKNKHKHQEYNKRNLERANEWHRNYYRENFNHRIKCIVRATYRKTLLMGGDKVTFEAKGIDKKHDQIIAKIRDNMLDGMTEDNYGELWEIDHKYPISRYIAEGIIDPEVINHPDNLIPMWKEHNRMKSDMTLNEWLARQGEDSEEWKMYSHFL